MHLKIHKLTALNSFILEIQDVCQVFEKFPVYYESGKFINVFTKCNQFQRSVRITFLNGLFFYGEGLFYN
jgi:hypothetical protein